MDIVTVFRPINTRVNQYKNQYNNQSVRNPPPRTCIMRHVRFSQLPRASLNRLSSKATLQRH